jgi:hypothetical protein
MAPLKTVKELLGLLVAMVLAKAHEKEFVEIVDSLLAKE